MNDERMDLAHEEAADLLPWYVTGVLQPEEHARVAAHVAGCAACQAEVETERRLEHAVAGLPLQLEHGWADMRRRLDADAAAEAAMARPAPRRPIWRRPEPRVGWSPAAVLAGRRPEPWLGWSLAASLAVVAGLSGYAVAPRSAPEAAPTYHVLSSQQAPSPGNVIVIFRPDLREREMRAVLNANHARLVEGPTAADAYVLKTPPAEREAILARLRADPGVVLAQPLDPAASP